MTNPMGVMKPKTAIIDKLTYPLIAQLKYDGVRLITLIRNGEITFWTYNGKEVPLPYLHKKFMDSCLDNIMLDGEIVITGGIMKDRTSVSGMINSAMHGGTINERILQYAVFDAMSILDYNRKYCNTVYHYRYRLVNELVCAVGCPLIIARNTIVKSAEEVTTLVEQIYRDGLEGLILKSSLHIYSFKRDKVWARIKQIKTADLECIDIQEGTGKYEGMIGSLILRGTVNGYPIKVKAGSGLTDNDRSMPHDWFIGRTIEVKYNTLIQDSVTGLWSLFLPRYSCRRFDK